MKIYNFLVKNTVILISFAINSIDMGHVATFNNVVNPFLQNGICRNGIEGQMLCNNVILGRFYLGKFIYSDVN